MVVPLLQVKALGTPEMIFTLFMKGLPVFMLLNAAFACVYQLSSMLIKEISLMLHQDSLRLLHLNQQKPYQGTFVSALDTGPLLMLARLLLLMVI